MSAHSAFLALALPAVLAAGLLRVVGTGDKPAVNVTKVPASFEEKVLDPANPPEAIRRELGKHKAYTSCSYALHWGMQDALRSKKTVDGNVEATFVITRIDATLNFDVTTYLPANVSKKLQAHEAGHKRIGEGMYESAEVEARRLAQAKIGRTYTGKGATLELARTAATNTAGNELVTEYLAAVQEEGQRIQVLYDSITDHGRDASVEEDDAIKRAFDERKKQKAENAK